MFLTKEKLMEACAGGIISEEQVNRLCEFFSLEPVQDTEPRQKFNLETVLYYGGSLIALGAMIYYMHDVVNSSTYAFILLLSIVYSLIYFFTADFMWKENHKTPAGLLYMLFNLSISYIVLVITKMTWLYPKFSDAIYYDDFYDASKPALFIIFLVTLLSSVLTLKRRPLSIAVIPVIAAIYGVFVLYIPDLLDKIPFIKHDGGMYYTLIFSVILLVLAFVKDRVYSIDYSKWMYFVSAFSMSVSFTFIAYLLLDMNGHEYLTYFVLIIFNIMFIILSILLQRTVFLFLGGLGFFIYLVVLETSALSDIHANSFVVISAVLLTGLAVIFAGIFYKNNINKIEDAVERFIPENFRKYLPKNK